MTYKNFIANFLQKNFMFLLSNSRVGAGKKLAKKEKMNKKQVQKFGGLQTNAYLPKFDSNYMYIVVP